MGGIINIHVKVINTKIFMKVKKKKKQLLDNKNWLF